MIDFPLDELLDEQASVAWLEHYLHPEGLKCPRCGRSPRRVARRLGALTAYRCKACDRYHSIWWVVAVARCATLFVITPIRLPARTYLRGFRGGHKKYLALYMATYETMRQAKQISSQVIQRMCFTHQHPHSDHT